jgi:hypothetical protein
MSSFSDTPSLVAGGTIAPYRFVKVSARNTGVAVSAVTDIAVGVTDGSTRKFDSSDHAITGDAINLQGGNVVIVEAAAAITAGVAIAPSANGRAQTAVATQFPYGIALEPAGAAGELIRVYKQAGTSVF